MIKYMIVLFLILCVSQSKAQLFNTQEVVEDTIPAVMDIIPNHIEVVDDSSRFFSRTVKILNRGGGVLTIKKIHGSCSCSHGYILSNNVYPLSVGEIRLEINKDGFGENEDSAIFSIESNAKNSPFHLIVKFVKKVEILTD